MRRLALALCALIVLCAGAALAAYPVGDPVNPVADPAGEEQDIAIGMDAEGDVYVVWQQLGAADDDLRMRHFPPAGSPGLERPVPVADAGQQDDPAIAVNAGGSGVVSWEEGVDDDQDIKARRIGPNGPSSPNEDMVAVSDTVNDQDSAVAIDHNGGYVVTWEHHTTTTGRDIQVRRFPSGQPTGPVQDVSTEVGNQDDPAVASDADGDFVVVWTGAGASGQDPSGVFARRYNSAGVAQGGAIEVNQGTFGPQERAAVAMDADGDFVVAWVGPTPTATEDTGVFARRFGANGVPQGDEFPLDSTRIGSQARPFVTLDDDGDLAAAWEGAGPGDADGVFTRDFSASGTPLTGDVLVNAETTGLQERGRIASDADGDFAVAWFSGAGTDADVFFRRFRRGAAPTGGGGTGGGGSPGGTGQQPPPPVLDDMGLPVLTDGDVGVKANVALVSGTVLLGIPPGLPTAAAVRRSGDASQKGVTFVPLTQARQIPIGSFLDTRRGTVRLRTATGSQDGTQTGDFGRGLFQVLQSRTASARALTTLVLKGGKFGRSRCGARRSSAGALASQVSRRTIRRLRSNARGRFRTRGRHSAATVRGTVWQTSDRCDGTLTKVTRGSVVVRDFRRRRNIVVRAGKRTKGPGGGRGSYLARAR